MKISRFSILDLLPHIFRKASDIRFWFTSPEFIRSDIFHWATILNNFLIDIFITSTIISDIVSLRSTYRSESGLIAWRIITCACTEFFFITVNPWIYKLTVYRSNSDPDVIINFSPINILIFILFMVFGGGEGLYGKIGCFLSFLINSNTDNNNTC